MGVRYLWDTNTVVYFLQQQFNLNAEKFIDELLLNQTPIISAITEIELLCWKTTNQKDTELLHNFINDALANRIRPKYKIKNGRN